MQRISLASGSAKPRAATDESATRTAQKRRRSVMARGLRECPLVTSAVSTAARELGIERHPAVDVERDAVHVVGVVAREPDGGLADVLGLADAPVRDERQERAERFRRAPGRGVDRRPDGARRDRVHADLERRELLRERLHEEHHAALRRRVVGVPRPGNLLVYRAHAQDLARRARDRGDDAAALELAHGFPGAEELAGEVDRDDLVPLRERHLVESRVALQPCIVDEDLPRAERLEGAAEHVRDLGLDGDVGPQRQRAASRAHDLLRHFDRLVLAVAVVDDDVGAGLAEREGDGLADSRVRAGDERLLAREGLILSHWSSPVPGSSFRASAAAAVTRTPQRNGSAPPDTRAVDANRAPYRIPKEEP